MSKEKPYPPKMRTDYDKSGKKLQSFSPSGDSTFIPNPSTDPIVVNNIAWQEFDYTEELESSNEDDF